MAYFNDAQVELAMKTGLLVRVEAHYYPPRFDHSYMFDWEKGYLEGDSYQALTINQASGGAITSPWEAAYWLSAIQTDNDNITYTNPWEIQYCSQAMPPAIPLHVVFDKMLFIAYDQDKLFPISKRELESADPFYESRTGQPTHYWRPDDYSNIFYPYPLPSTVVHQDEDESLPFEDTGGISASAEAWLDEADTGIATDIVNVANAFFMVYTAQPTEIDLTTDESDFVSWAVKYCEYGALERAYGADTDGYIPSLRDYWKLRKEIGVKALMRFRRMMLTDRDFRLGGQPRTATSRRLRLPDGYPAL
jgi:hypothetical protein